LSGTAPFCVAWRPPLRVSSDSRVCDCLWGNSHLFRAGGHSCTSLLRRTPRSTHLPSHRDHGTLRSTPVPDLCCALNPTLQTATSTQSQTASSSSSQTGSASATASEVRRTAARSSHRDISYRLTSHRRYTTSSPINSALHAAAFQHAVAPGADTMPGVDINLVPGSRSRRRYTH